MSFQANIDTYKLTQLPRLCTLNMDNYVRNFQSLLFKGKRKNKDTKNLTRILQQIIPQFHRKIKILPFISL